MNSGNVEVSFAYEIANFQNGVILSRTFALPIAQVNTANMWLL